ncbi:hypothetical protein BpHYR1_031784 [Brachionus plicatilis]|uniref:Uncharacterized protein n=1 Tax=Brachionus plicatilis TaxID=10195 RepID=A0A3M7RXS9_BRAPC|nr:hypothetical protein BpHYR1_031784 [Brachionus plicatilis]
MYTKTGKINTKHYYINKSKKMQQTLFHKIAVNFLTFDSESDLRENLLGDWLVSADSDIDIVSEK